MQARTPEIIDALFALMRASHSYGTAWYVADDLTGIARPYGVIDEVFVNDNSYQGGSGADHLFTLHYYEDTARAAVAAMQSAIPLLHGVALTLATGTNYCTTHDGEQVFRDGEPESMFAHGIQSWRIRTDG